MWAYNNVVRLECFVECYTGSKPRHIDIASFRATETPSKAGLDL